MATPATNSPLSRANAAANNNQNGTGVGQTKQPCPVFDLIVLVAGTVDPVNTNASSFANSSSKLEQQKEKADPNTTFVDRRTKETAEKEGKPDDYDPNYYWAGNTDFIQPLVDFQTSYDHVHVYRDYSWSGDNNVHNRVLAGAGLGESLAGLGKHPAVRTWLKYKVSLHFIGHSHGGNVINEVTKRIAKLGAWPAAWKIKSVTYLSTPFFSTIHRPLTTRFHAKARICNVYCQYDLTQTAIADFSLRALTRVTQVMTDAQKTLTPIIDRITNFDFSSLWALVNWKPNLWDGLLNFDSNMEPTKGRNLYDRVIALLDDVKALFVQVKKILATLNQPTRTVISEVFEGKKLVTHRKILSDAMRAKIDGELDKVLAGLQPARDAFAARITTGVYPVAGFVDDLHVESLVVTLVNLLDVNPTSLDGNLTSLLYQAFKEQIEVFDDTVWNCDFLYKGWPIVEVDVTREDAYYKLRDKQFYVFKGRLVAAEAAYMGAPSQHGFLHMLFLLAAQLEPVATWAFRLRVGVNVVAAVMKAWSVRDSTSSFYLRMQDLIALIRHWLAVYDARECGGIVYTKSKIEPPGAKEGSIPYLAIVSHSVSRQKLYPDVDKFLREQFDSHEVKAKR